MKGKLTLLLIVFIFVCFGLASCTSKTKTYTVTFDTDGGSDVQSQTVNEGEKVTKPANPTKTDFNFVDWYSDQAKENVWEFDKDVVNSDITLYAKWEANVVVEDNSYKVSVVDDNNAPVKDVSVQWCNSTNCFAPVKTNAEGVAINSKLKTGDTYYVHLVESTIPQGYTYDPNLYTQTDDSKEITVKLIKLSTVTGEGSKESPYNIGVGAYHLEINSLGDRKYYAFTPTEAGSYTINSHVMEIQNTNPINTLIAVYEDSSFSKVIKMTDGKTNNFTYTIDAQANTTYYFLIAESQISASSNPVIYPVEFYFDITLNN